MAEQGELTFCAGYLRLLTRNRLPSVDVHTINMIPYNRRLRRGFISVGVPMPRGRHQ